MEFTEEQGRLLDALRDEPSANNDLLAERLEVSVKTVKAHLTGIYKALGAPDGHNKRAHLVVWLLERGR